jgi:hypothetical protein
VILLGNILPRIRFQSVLRYFRRNREKLIYVYIIRVLSYQRKCFAWHRYSMSHFSEGSQGSKLRRILFAFSLPLLRFHVLNDLNCLRMSHSNEYYKYKDCNSMTIQGLADNELVFLHYSKCFNQSESSIIPIITCAGELRPALQLKHISLIAIACFLILDCPIS